MTNPSLQIQALFLIIASLHFKEKFTCKDDYEDEALQQACIKPRSFRKYREEFWGRGILEFSGWEGFWKSISPSVFCRNNLVLGGSCEVQADVIRCSLEAGLLTACDVAPGDWRRGVRSVWAYKY
jgi:hypothetical protein